ncbi:GntR family transcriptional regulator [Deinococcus koreensis]|uniref:GntR family transcriptional regulator n=2 Tax=Deinococcus koreensis TaxID=2054903 RepID=A0A2K3UXT0_9DEIO|nr:GntR family transcriptional regulator [Deinococcus koreensis]
MDALKSSLELGSLDPGSHVPASAQLRRALTRLIEGGSLRPGDALPPVRSLAAALALAPNTVAKAYAALGRDGLTVSRAGAGTVVAAGAWQGSLEQRSALQGWQRHTRDLRAAGIRGDDLRAALEAVLLDEGLDADNAVPGAAPLS